MGAIDVESLSEWVLAKAEKRGVARDMRNVEVVRDAVTRAIDAHGDEVHIVCTVYAENDPIQIDEHLTRTAAENLFAPPPPGHPKAPLVAEPPRRPTPRPAARREEERATPERPDAPRVFGMDRGAFIVVTLVIGVLLIVIAIVTGTSHEHSGRHERSEEHR